MQNDNLNEIVEKYKEKDTSKGFFFSEKKKCVSTIIVIYLP